MSGKIPNLWPDELIVNTDITPKSIMCRQAQVLNERTRGRVQGEVSTRVLGRDFTHTFYLVTPGLDNYRHFLLRVRHSIEQTYPLKVFLLESDDTGKELATEELFYQVLGRVLQDSKTMHIIRSLAAQSE
ncbi:MAG: hypothetical protein HYV26_19210 [Candidatus Hydrogenedentes bacterium]|nr:hypothetical protein [Candidatus Hydrogenedentota bacterium]MBI3118554.1 hypothetical protein [Candidatus Hydrogenedentota bacterium]